MLFQELGKMCLILRKRRLKAFLCELAALRAQFPVRVI